jgi:hypothetical protein
LLKKDGKRRIFTPQKLDEDGRAAEGYKSSWWIRPFVSLLMKWRVCWRNALSIAMHKLPYDSAMLVMCVLAQHGVGVEQFSLRGQF